MAESKEKPKEKFETAMVFHYTTLDLRSESDPIKVGRLINDAGERGWRYVSEIKNSGVYLFEYGELVKMPIKEEAPVKPAYDLGVNVDKKEDKKEPAVK